MSKGNLAQVPVSAGIEGLFVEETGSGSDAFLCGLWAFGEGFEEFQGSQFVDAWNNKHWRLFRMSEGDSVPESVSKIVKHWREYMGVKATKPGKAVTVCRIDEPKCLPKGTPQGLKPRDITAPSSLERLNALEHKMKFWTLKQDDRYNYSCKQFGKVDKCLDAQGKSIHTLDNSLAAIIKRVILLEGRMRMVGDLNKTLTNKVSAMAKEIDAIKKRMQVAQKVAPKVEGKFQKAAKKVNAKLPKSFGKVR